MTLRDLRGQGRWLSDTALAATDFAPGAATLASLGVETISFDRILTNMTCGTCSKCIGRRPLPQAPQTQAASRDSRKP